MIARDIYAFYPLLIKYVDLQRNLWIRHNVAESEELYNHVGEVFNTMNISLVGMRKSIVSGMFRVHVSSGTREHASFSDPSIS